MQSFAYLLTVRQGRKWVAIAGTNSGGCLAASETVFSYHGLTGQACWGATMERQKNYAGRSPDFRAVELSDEARALHWFKQTLAAPHYPDLASFLATFPDAERFRDELTRIKP